MSDESFVLFPPACAIAGLVNSAFAKILRGARGFELDRGPFQKQGTYVAESPMLSGSELLEFDSQRWPDSQTHGCFPFAHELTSYLQLKPLRAQQFQWVHALRFLSASTIFGLQSDSKLSLTAPTPKHTTGGPTRSQLKRDTNTVAI